MGLLTLHHRLADLLEINATMEIFGSMPRSFQAIRCGLDFAQARNPLFPMNPIGNLFIVRAPIYNKSVINSRSLIICECIPKSPIGISFHGMLGLAASQSEMASGDCLRT
jgi:hypothetical protein